MDEIKGLRFATFTKNEDRRELRGMASTVDVDLIGDVMIPSGAKFDRMRPGVTLHHDDQIVVGTHVKHEVQSGGIYVRTKVGQWPEAEAFWKMVQDGAIAAWSIEFSMIDYGPPTPAESKAYGPNARRVGRKWYMDGYSGVHRPCNPKAAFSETKDIVRDWLTREVKAGRLTAVTALKLGMESENPVRLILGRSGLRWKIAG